MLSKLHAAKRLLQQPDRGKKDHAQLELRNMGKRNGEVNGVHASNGDMKDSLVLCQTSQGLEIRGTLARLTRYVVAFEIYNPAIVLRLSEVLGEFRIVIGERVIYAGRAVVRSLVNTGLMTVCEVTLDDHSWKDVQFTAEMVRNGELRDEFKEFIQSWQKLYRVTPDYKVAIADLQTFLSDLRLWLEQVELGIRSSPSANRVQLEQEVAQSLRDSVVPAIGNLFERFEAVSQRVEEDLRLAHRAFGKRQLHPLLLCSPFVYRTFHKPLGYAGDYEVVNMMFRDPYEGSSLFAKMVNAYALQLPPIVGHRNRITYLLERLVEETRRITFQHRKARVFNMGCGPAQEIQRFLIRDHVCDEAQFTLADFNDETLAHANGVLEELKKRHRRSTAINLVKRSVHHMLKQADRTIQYPAAEQYDMIYCAGLFDYLSDRVCAKLTEIFYDMLAPDGLLIVTNVDVHAAWNEMECFLEWHLVHRNPEQMLALVPRKASRENVALKRDPTGVNVFMEIRKAKK
jgi:extracellular factor (EF) 3-hydroxypalmitic acid methyl ester biosynthesis protein